MDSLLIGGTVGTIILSIGLYLYSSKRKPNDSIKKSNSSNKIAVDDNMNKYPAGSVSIYFGSQTGTAEGYSRTLMEELQAKGFDAQLVDLEDFDQFSFVESKLAIFLMSTYGEGEPTDNASNFYHWIKNEDKQIDNNFLNSVGFSVFGLGNRQYEFYNRMGKFTNQGLEDLGGKRVFDYGEGDDDGSLEEDFEKWKNLLVNSLVNQFHPNSASMKVDDNQEVKKVHLLYNLIPSKKNTTSIRTNQMSSSTKHFFTAPQAQVISNRELRNGNNCGSTRHIEIDLNGTEIIYETADNLAVLPENNNDIVNSLANILGYNLNDSLTISPILNGKDANSFKYPFPSPCSIRDILTVYLDLQGVPRYDTVNKLVPYINDPGQLLWLKQLLSKESRSGFKSFIEENGKSVSDLIITELSSIKITIAELVHIVPFNQPRFYTISSSSSCFPSSVHITVSVTEKTLNNGKLFRGLCSGYLQNSSKCRIFVRASSFRLPKSLNTPIVMIGPGTGFAPMRALLQERKFQSLKSGNKVNNVSNTLYFGCQNRNIDYIYNDEIEKYNDEGTISKLNLAFSREKNEKVYVQHLLSEESNSLHLMEVINSGGYIFVCGSTKMGSDVHEAILNIIVKHKGQGMASAKDFVHGLQTQQRYIQELWSA
jgi:NADPH-ferrihemoprotein reductase